MGSDYSMEGALGNGDYLDIYIRRPLQIP